MHTIQEFRQLERFGFNILTGEACNLGLRILCDVNEDGKLLFCRTLGIPVTSELSEPWNPRSLIQDKIPVGSVFVPRDLYGTLAVFCLYSLTDVSVVLQVQQSFLGLGKNEEYHHHQELYDLAVKYNYDELRRVMFMDETIRKSATIRIYRGIQPDNTVRNGSCVHAYSGRSQ